MRRVILLLLSLGLLLFSIKCENPRMIDLKQAIAKFGFTDGKFMLKHSSLSIEAHFTSDALVIDKVTTGAVLEYAPIFPPLVGKSLKDAHDVKSAYASFKGRQNNGDSFYIQSGNSGFYFYKDRISFYIIFGLSKGSPVKYYNSSFIMEFKETGFRAAYFSGAASFFTPSLGDAIEYVPDDVTTVTIFN